MAYGPPVLAGQRSQPNSHINAPPRLSSITQRAIQGHPNWGYPAPRIGGTGAPAPLPGVQAPTKKPPAPKPAPKPGPNPLDATYWQNVTDNNAKTGLDINSLSADAGSARIALQSALGQLAYQQPRDSLSLEQNANNRGALYSSVYGQQQGDLATKYYNQAQADQTNTDQQVRGDQDKIAQILADQQTFNDQQYQSSVERAANIAAKDPGSAAVKAPPKPGGTKPAKPGKPGKPPPNRIPKPRIGGSGGNFTVGLGQPRGGSHRGAGSRRSSGSGVVSGGG